MMQRPIFAPGLWVWDLCCSAKSNFVVVLSDTWRHVLDNRVKRAAERSIECHLVGDFVWRSGGIPLRPGRSKREGLLGPSGRVLCQEEFNHLPAKAGDTEFESAMFRAYIFKVAEWNYWLEVVGLLEEQSPNLLIHTESEGCCQSKKGAFSACGKQLMGSCK